MRSSIWYFWTLSTIAVLLLAISLRYVMAQVDIPHFDNVSLPIVRTIEHDTASVQRMMNTPERGGTYAVMYVDIYADTDNFVDIDTLYSVEAREEEGETRCSETVRTNLTALTGLPLYSGLPRDASAIAQGHTLSLIEQGLAQDLLFPLSQDPDEILFHLTHTYIHGGQGTIFDVYMVQHEYEDLQDAHRALFFLGIDMRIYVLDPYRAGATQKPQLLEDYLRYAGLQQYDIYMLPWAYHPAHERYITLLDE